ncbi:MAG: hypothetical protein V2A73_10520, partial [Pseudomonadota bacterium]
PRAAQEPPPDAAAPDERRTPIQVTASQERLLRTVGDAGVIPTTYAFRLAGLSRQPGTTAKTGLVTFGLLTAASVLVRAGRGGNAQVLRVTREGYALLGRQPPYRTRGGDGDQHYYNVVTLAKALPDAVVECMVGEKSVDLLVTYDPSRHQRLLAQMNDKDVAPGALLAIEVEASAAAARTALNNITKNAAVGIAHTVVAVMPKHVEKTKTSLEERVPADLRDAYTVVDVFDLIAGLKR